MLPGAAERNLALIEEANQVLTGDVEQIGGLLRRQLLPDRHHRDRVPAGEHFDDPFEDVEHGLGDLNALPARANQLAPGRLALRVGGMEQARQLADLRLLISRRRNRGHAANLIFDRSGRHGASNTSKRSRNDPNATMEFDPNATCRWQGRRETSALQCRQPPQVGRSLDRDGAMGVIVLR